MDAEQVQLGTSDKFWNLMRARRGEETISRAALDEEIKRRTSRTKRTGRRVSKKVPKPRNRGGV